MCLSTVYKNKKSPEDVIMQNVMKVECRDGCVILTDLMTGRWPLKGSCRRPIWWTVSSLSGRMCLYKELLWCGPALPGHIVFVE